MENPRRLTILIARWPRPRAAIRRLLLDLLEDLRDERIVVFPLPPIPPWDWDDWPRRLREFDIDHREYLLHRWWWHYPDWPLSHREWRRHLMRALRRLPELPEPRAVVVFGPVGPEEALDVEQLHDLVKAVEPAQIVDLTLGEADRRMADLVPEALSFNYPEDRVAFLEFLRSLPGEREVPAAQTLAERLAMARCEFADRTADQERPKITTAYPEAMAPLCWATVEVFLYLREYRKLVEKEIRWLQAREELDYAAAASELPRSLPSGCPIRICLHSEALHTNPSETTINWYEPYNRLPFRISPIDEERDGYSATLDVDVFADDLPVASMRLAIAVTSDVRGERTSPATSDAAWYEDIFASYAREDLQLVKHLKERYEALGLYMFIDLDDLRAGASWKTALFGRIDSSDLFQLFWSEHARRSKCVTEEWRHALHARAAKGGRFIRPVYWQDPIPTVPEELKDINFRRINFVES